MTPPLDRLCQQSSMDHWWPKIPEAVTVPKTVPIHLPDADKEDESYFDRHCPDVEEVLDAVEAVGGPPAFLRTAQSSAKHTMGSASRLDTTDPDVALEHVMRTVDASLMSPLTNDFSTFYVREWLPLHARFTAFEDCPIAAELRFFIDDGAYHDHGFYWPKEAIARVDQLDWERDYEEVRQTALDRADEAVEQLNAVAREFTEGYWSVDFALAEDRGWVLLDMARGELSWHPEGVEKLYADPRYES